MKLPWLGYWTLQTGLDIFLSFLYRAYFLVFLFTLLVNSIFNCFSQDLYSNFSFLLSSL